MGKKRKTVPGVWLDYRQAASKKLLGNISAAAMAGRYLWTASDEGRTVECLEPHKRGFRLHKQIGLDDVFASLPGDAKDELDIEALSISDGTLWICGSHCRVRRNRTNTTTVDPRLRARPSRCLLGAVELRKDGGGLVGAGRPLPYRGTGSLRTLLGANPYIAPFINLPSKENGLDIEGLCVAGRRLFLGLRGPVVDSIALAMELAVAATAVAWSRKPVAHFLDLGGLGIRDLAAHGGQVLIVAGPVSAANGPFRLYHWRPRRSDRVQRPRLLMEWTGASTEHPEGICILARKRRQGLLVLYDAPDQTRIKKSRYRADWIPLARLGLGA